MNHKHLQISDWISAPVFAVQMMQENWLLGITEYFIAPWRTCCLMQLSQSSQELHIKKQLKNLINWSRTPRITLKSWANTFFTSARILRLLYVVFTIYNNNPLAPLKDTQPETTTNEVFWVPKRKDTILFNDDFNFRCLTNSTWNQEWHLKFQWRK